MSNHLRNETSPYLLQHAENPVDWYPWSEEAFRRAREEDKPVFLSVGYSTCHWCHVMARESFEDPETAELLNRWFIAIKVDREERPDVDSVYMTVCQAFAGSGGWPASIFLTPEKQPFFAGTYFPKHSQDDPPPKVTVVLSDKSEVEKLLLAFPPEAVVILREASTEYPLKNGATTFYVCQDHRCLPPINELPVL